jgi:hypothetical protein
MYKVEVIADSSGKWCGNGKTFGTQEQARAYANDLMWRWTAVDDWRVVDTAAGLVVLHMGGPACVAN